MIEFRECENPLCRFRYPATLEDAWPNRGCPSCGGPTKVVGRAVTAEGERVADEPGRRLPVEGLLDNVRSVFNVGSIFRSADGAGLRRLILCGITPTPDHPKLAKTALGAERTITWEYGPNGVLAAGLLRERGYQLWTIEEAAAGISLFDCRRLLDHRPLALVVGNELAGVDPDIRRLSDAVVGIPMAGAKRSLNVAIAFAVVAYFVAEASQD